MTERRASPVRRAPWPLLVLAALALLLYAVPLVAVLVEVPWSALLDLLGDDSVLDALRLSLLSALAATALSLVLGVPLAWVLARVDLPGRSLVRGLVLLPMVLPPVVGGAALLFAFGRRGMVGEWLYDHADVLLPYSPAGVVLAQTFVAMPFLVITVEAGLRSTDRRYDEVAATLGARPGTTFWRVTLPSIRPALIAGAVLCWARALGEFGATITFAGNLEGRTRTVPLAVFLALERDREAALALSLVLVVVSLAVIVALRDRWMQLR